VVLACDQALNEGEARYDYSQQPANGESLPPQFPSGQETNHQEHCHSNRA